MTFITSHWKHQIRGGRHTSKKRSTNVNFLGDFVCLRSDQHHIEGQEPGEEATPLACTFSKVQPNLVAVADEEGGILILDSFKTGLDAVIQDWRAHNNAIFDVDWTPGENKLLTASGDQSIQHLDVEKEEVISTFKGHSASVRTVRCCDNPNIFATGARDGHVMVWDRRITAKSGFLPPVNILSNAHGAPQEIGSAKKKRTPKAQQKSSKHTVTAVVFQDDNTLISSGCVDGSLKLWDLRKTYTNLKSEPVPFHRFLCTGSSTRTHGFSSLLLDESRTRLFANCMDNTIYMYDCAGFSKNPIASYKGHTNSSFYIKMSLSRDDLYLLSGSSGGQGYIWHVEDPQKPPLVLNCHSEEISGVAWSPIDHSVLMTVSDDCSICTWRSVRPDHLSLLRSTIKPALSELIGTSEWTPDLRVAASSAATPRRTSLPMGGTPERLLTPTLSHRPRVHSPLVAGITKLAESPADKSTTARSLSLTQWMKQGTDVQRSPLLSPVKTFGCLSSPLKSPKHIHVLLSPRKFPIPGCFDALSPRKTPSAKTSAGPVPSSSKSVKRKLCEISDSGCESSEPQGKMSCRGLRNDSATPVKTPVRVFTSFENITPSRTCVQNLQFTPNKIEQSPTVNLPNYVLNPEPRTPQPSLPRSDSLKENSTTKGQNWLRQLSKQRKEDQEKLCQSEEDGSSQTATPKGGRKKDENGTPKSVAGLDKGGKGKTPQSSRTPRSAARNVGTPKSVVKTPAASLGQIKEEKLNPQTPRSSGQSGSSVKRSGNTLRLSKTKTPTSTRRSILSYFSPKDQDKK